VIAKTLIIEDDGNAASSVLGEGVELTTFPSSNIIC